MHDSGCRGGRSEKLGPSVSSLLRAKSDADQASLVTTRMARCGIISANGANFFNCFAALQDRPPCDVSSGGCVADFTLAVKRTGRAVGSARCCVLGGYLELLSWPAAKVS